MKIVAQNTEFSERMERIIKTGKFENHSGTIENYDSLEWATNDLIENEKDMIDGFLDLMKTED